MDVNNHMDVHHRKSEPWKITLVDTGDLTETGGRLRRVMQYLNGSSFVLRMVMELLISM